MIFTHQKVFKPLKNLIDLLEVPNKFIAKRHDKLLDYECARLNYARMKDKSLLKILQENMYDAQKNYEALNNQLHEELPRLIKMCSFIFEKCFKLYLVILKDFHEKIARYSKNLAAITLSSRNPDVCMYVCKISIIF